MKGKALTKLTVFIAVLALFFVVFITGIPFSRYFGVYDLDATVNRISFGLDLKGGVSVILEAQGDDPVTSEDIAQTIQVLDSRINSLGVKEPTITAQGDRQIRISLPDIQDQQLALDTIGRTAKLQFIDPEGNVILTGSDVKSAQFMETTDSSGLYSPVVSLAFTEEGSVKFAEATSTWLGQAIDIVLDDEVISSPIVQSVISDGQAIINQIPSAAQAKNLALLIRGGALPLDMIPIQVETIGSSLGQDALRNSLVAGVVGAVLVMIFMAVVYRLPGFAADIALLAYILLFLNCMALLKVTLTLPGIAGIILSVGMAVDANVIIFERIKEEVIGGRAIIPSVSIGYKGAMSSIIDSNITTIIAGFALFSFGSGSVRGFALTLMIGVAVSMITAITMTKAILLWFVRGFGLDKPTLFGGGAKA